MEDGQLPVFVLVKKLSLFKSYAGKSRDKLLLRAYVTIFNNEVDSTYDISKPPTQKHLEMKVVTCAIHEIRGPQRKS